MSYYEKLTKKRCNYRNLVHREERWIFVISFDIDKVWKLFTQVLFLSPSNRRTCKQSARWLNLDLAKRMFCSSSIRTFALSIIIDNYKEVLVLSKWLESCSNAMDGCGNLTKLANSLKCLYKFADQVTVSNHGEMSDTDSAFQEKRPFSLASAPPGPPTLFAG